MFKKNKNHIKSYLFCIIVAIISFLIFYILNNKFYLNEFILGIVFGNLLSIIVSTLILLNISFNKIFLYLIILLNIGNLFIIFKTTKIFFYKEQIKKIYYFLLILSFFIWCLFGVFSAGFILNPFTV